MNGGYYCIGCRGCGVVNIEYVDVTGVMNRMLMMM